jgi:hypothetical protein
MKGLEGEDSQTAAMPRTVPLHVQQSREEMEVLFTFFAERYERKSVIITSNVVFSEWGRIFKDPMTTAAAIDRLVHHSVIIEMTGTSIRMSREEITALFDGFAPALYEDEVKERWGKTAAYKESARRTSQYTKADWEQYKAESHAIMTDAAQLFRSGASADCDEAMAVAVRHRLSIDRWFYPCGPEMHAGLADMYEADARFANSIDQYAPGLTAWWSAAIRTNARC